MASPLRLVAGRCRDIFPLVVQVVLHTCDKAERVEEVRCHGHEVCKVRGQLRVSARVQAVTAMKSPYLHAMPRQCRAVWPSYLLTMRWGCRSSQLRPLRLPRKFGFMLAPSGSEEELLIMVLAFA